MSRMLSRLIVVGMLFVTLFTGTAHGAVETNAAPTSQPARASTVVDAFAKTRLFQLAEGKQTTSLQEMMQLGFWVDTIKELVVAAVTFVPRLLVSVLFLFVFWLIYRAVRKVALSAMNSATLDPAIRDTLLAIIRWTIMGFGIVIACNQVGIPIVAMLTGVSILGLAVGFAAQETISNFIAGVVIFWDKPFKAGDWLTIEGTFGKVQRITFRSCRFLTPAGEVAIFPNTFMLSRRLLNHTAHPLSRITVQLPIQLGTEGNKWTIPAAKQRLMSTINGDYRVLNKPEPEVIVADVTDANVILQMRFWVSDPSLEQAMANEYREKAKLALDPLAGPSNSRPMPMAA